MASSTDKISNGVEHAEKVFPPFDFTTLPSQLLWLIVSFGIFYFLIAKLVLPRIGSILEMRSDKIAQDLDEANKLQGESQDAQQAYEEELVQAKANAVTIAQEAKEKAKTQLEKKRKTVESDIAKQMQQSEKEILAAKNKALANVKEIAVPTVKIILDKIFAENISEAEIAKTMDKIKE